MGLRESIESIEPQGNSFGRGHAVHRISFTIFQEIRKSTLRVKNGTGERLHSGEAIVERSSFLHPDTNDIHLHPDATRVEVLEEYFHYLQRYDEEWIAHLARRQDELREAVGGWGFLLKGYEADKKEFYRIAEELHVKQMLLDHADFLELTGTDRFILDRAIREI